MRLTTLCALAAGLLSLAITGSGNASGDAALLATLKAPQGVTEAQDYPWVPYADLPKDVQKRHKRGTYDSKCKSRYEKGRGRYFDIRYKSLDGKAVEGVLAVPVGFDPKKAYPTIVMNHGGSGDRGRFTSCSVSYIDRFLTKQGYVVFYPQYRPASAAKALEVIGKGDVNDVLAMLEIARQYPFVDKKNIFFIGESRGGMVTYLALKRGAKVNAAVILCGLTNFDDFSEKHRKLIEKFSGLEGKALRDAFIERSVVNWPQSITVPILMLHGEADKVTPLKGTQRLAQALDQQGVEHKLVTFPKGKHCLKGAKGYEPEVYAWLKKYSR